MKAKTFIPISFNLFRIRCTNVLAKSFFFIAVEDMEQYLQYIGGGAGALALTGVAAASALYLVSRPTSQKPLFPLDQQCIVEPVSFFFNLDESKY